MNNKVKFKANIDRMFDNPQSTLKAIASVTVENAIAIHGIKLCKQGDEFRIYMPQNSYMKNGEKKYEDYVHPITREARFDLDNAVIYAYEQRLHMREDQEYIDLEDEEEPEPVMEQTM
ncbi:MAG: SpoVG family protein [Clostridia bacterium]|nr:SpoVG family protein [Clostridia bacterium]